MARCGCTTFPTCSCVLVGDGTSVTFVGSGAGVAPYRLRVTGIPQPRPYGIAYRITQQAMTGSDDVITFDNGIGTPASEPTTMWNVANPTRLVAPVAGLYLINSSVRTDDTGGFFSTSTGTQRARQRIRLNGTTMIASRNNALKQPAIVNQNGNYSLMTIYRLAANDYVEMTVQLTAMVDALTGPAVNRASLQLRWMGL